LNYFVTRSVPGRARLVAIIGGGMLALSAAKWMGWLQSL
jgi:hypothetical protein